MTKEAKYWHDMYEGLDVLGKCVVDAAYEEVRRVLRWDARCQPTSDDRAEELVAAITKYYLVNLY